MKIKARVCDNGRANISHRSHKNGPVTRSPVFKVTKSLLEVGIALTDTGEGIVNVARLPSVKVSSALSGAPKVSGEIRLTQNEGINHIVCPPGEAWEDG
jgi:hypothetical protein